MVATQNDSQNTVRTSLVLYTMTLAFEWPYSVTVFTIATTSHQNAMVDKRDINNTKCNVKSQRKDRNANHPYQRLVLFNRIN